MRSKRFSSDIDRATSNYRLLNEIISNIKETTLAHDPSFLKNLEEFRAAMDSHCEQIRLLSETPRNDQAAMARSRTMLVLVKR